MKVLMSMKETGGCFEFKNVVNAYTKGNLYCIMTQTKKKVTIHKYPMANIQSIAEVSPRGETIKINTDR